MNCELSFINLCVWVSLTLTTGRVQPETGVFSSTAEAMLMVFFWVVFAAYLTPPSALLALWRLYGFSASPVVTVNLCLLGDGPLPAEHWFWQEESRWGRCWVDPDRQAWKSPRFRAVQSCSPKPNHDGSRFYWVGTFNREPIEKATVIFLECLCQIQHGGMHPFSIKYRLC